MEFRGDEVVFDLFVDDVENEKDDGGNRGAEEEEEGNKDAADDGAEHWDKIEGHGDQTHGEGETAGEAAGQREEKDGDGCDAAVEDGDGDLFRDVGGDDAGEALGETFPGAESGVFAAAFKGGPEGLDDGWSFN